MLQGIPFGIAAGLVAGKVIGVFAASWLLIRCSGTRLPTDAGWRELAESPCCAASASRWPVHRRTRVRRWLGPSRPGAARRARRFGRLGTARDRRASGGALSRFAHEVKRARITPPGAKP
ncbi:MAG TPA: Na+/H+ antiporter NhaA [Caldimonas sp.]